MFENFRMKQDIKNKELRERQKYVPAGMMVITTSMREVICTSPNYGYPTEFEEENE